MLLLDDDFETAFSGRADLFEAEYDFKRPTKDNAENNKQLIILVASGRGDDRRAEEAARFLRSRSPSLGYPSIRVYAGGLEDWRRRGGRVRYSRIHSMDHRIMVQFCYWFKFRLVPNGMNNLLCKNIRLKVQNNLHKGSNLCP